MSVLVIHGIHDRLELDFRHAKATFCGLPWATFFDLSGLAKGDLWPSVLSDAQAGDHEQKEEEEEEERDSKRLKLDSPEKLVRSLFTAKLLWRGIDERDSKNLHLPKMGAAWDVKETEYWRKHADRRISIGDLCSFQDLKREYQWKREITWQVDHTLLR
jgi:hypothetical protein